MEHFSQMLNCPLIQSTRVTSPGYVEQYEIDLEPLDDLEITSVVHKMKNKSHGGDGLGLRIFKSCLPALLSPMTKLFPRM